MGVLDILTCVGLSVSSFSFLLVLVTYSLFKQLRTLPGINLMNFSMAHLLADLLFLLAGSATKLTCTIIAILMHYFFLASFTWMSFIAFETWRTFSTICIQRRNLTRREKCLSLMRRIAVGWLPAFAVVAVCVALHLFDADTFLYGALATSSKFCWIKNPTARLFAFALPVFIAILFNIVLFSLTVIAIRKTNRQLREATYHAKNRITAAVFVKIFSLMGFTWIFGFLQPLHRSFAYPFVIFTTFVGLYVALAFVFTPKIMSLYRAMLYSNKTEVVPFGAEVNNSAPKHERQKTHE